MPQVLTTDVSGVKRKDVREKLFHIDEANPSQVSEGRTGSREWAHPLYFIPPSGRT